jgi:hypothetical protein
MNFKRWWLGLVLIAVLCSFPPSDIAQQAAAGEGTSIAAGTVPQVVSYTGIVTDTTGKPLIGVTGMTFLLY